MQITMVEARDLPEAWFLCLRKTLTQGREYTIDRGSNVSILINSLVLLEFKNGLLQVCDIFNKLLLICLHLLKHGLLKLLEDEGLRLHDANHMPRASEEVPLFLLVCV